ncbi:MAG: hypothetical protein GTO71_10330 [Woeseiaceae bacterium]|nr:hypothetical protein [Woeseiaceae bacterium]NIP21469.1 hypothetical protein [Woeseiaceae bacterium]NIS90457.1 hypothetical protein [Woeseiaceae bacterium]
MITYAMSVRRSHVAAWFFLIAGLLFLSLDAFATDLEDEVRLSITTQSTRAKSDSGAGGVTTKDEFEALRVDGSRSSDKSAAMHSKAEAKMSQSANVDFWFYMADVELFNDLDGDGFYHGIDLLFDADTYYTFAEVYAVVYLSLNGGPWNEYAVTENFVINGATSDDDYVIVTELLSGYPSGSYDILIELFDTYDNSFVAWIGPDETPELAFLPLEDADRDVAEVPEIIVVHESGGGSIGAYFILVLALAALLKRRRARYA